MKIMIFTEGTVLMHRNALGLDREAIIKQVENNEESIRDFAAYIPIGQAARKIQRWKDQGAEIFYLTSRMDADEIDDVRQALKGAAFPAGCLLFRRSQEDYADVVKQTTPELLIEDDCASIGGAKETIGAQLDLSLPTKVIAVPEFGGIDHLPDDINKFLINN